MLFRHVGWRKLSRIGLLTRDGITTLEVILQIDYAADGPILLACRCQFLSWLWVRIPRGLGGRGRGHALKGVVVCSILSALATAGLGCWTFAGPDGGEHGGDGGTRRLPPQLRTVLEVLHLPPRRFPWLSW